MNFTSNPVLGKTLNFVDLRLSTVNTAEKLNSIFAPITRTKGLADNSHWLASRHSNAEFTEDRVSKAKAYSDNIKKSEFENMNIFERENNSVIRLTEN